MNLIVFLILLTSVWEATMMLSPTRTEVLLEACRPTHHRSTSTPCPRKEKLFEFMWLKDNLTR